MEVQEHEQVGFVLKFHLCDDFLEKVHLGEDVFVRVAVLPVEVSAG